MKTALISDFYGKRWLKISLRALHILALCGFCGGILFDIPNELWQIYWILTLVSGISLLLLDALSNLLWFVQVRGVVIMFKLCLIVLMFSVPSLAKPALFVALILSAIIAHAPSDLRYYSLYHRRKIKSLNDSKG
jgi:hypothetical protein